VGCYAAQVGPEDGTEGCAETCVTSCQLTPRNAQETDGLNYTVAWADLVCNPNDWYEVTRNVKEIMFAESNAEKRCYSCKWNFKQI
jgi:hypothetical protein